MTDDAARYARVYEILGGARVLRGATLRSFLEEHCRGDDALRAEVVELLELGSDDHDEDPFDESRVEGARLALEEVLEAGTGAWLPERIGDYTVLRQLGQGGMGVVYEAEQESPHRRVAIKLLHPMMATPERLKRFRQEAQVLGRLQHPGIAQIFEAGTFDAGRGPQPYFAMELVDGVDVRTYCERHDLSRDERLELLARVCDAVQYAHEQGIVHRDLKPDNVLVDGRGRPRILDFGIARANSQSATLSTIVTEEGQLVGTLAYMAPEQLSRASDAVTPRVDVYALGVLLFELETGRLPRQVGGLPISQAIALLASTEAPRASTLVPALRGDVETILRKALEPEPDRRYASAAALAADLRRHLENRPIEARPPSRVYLAGKFARRHRGLVAGTITTLLTLVAGVLVALAFADRAREQRDLARVNERSAIASVMQGAQVLIDAGRSRDAAAQLERVPVEHRGVAWRLLDRGVPTILEAPRGEWQFVDEGRLVGLFEDEVLEYSLAADRVVDSHFAGSGLVWLGDPNATGLLPAATDDELLLLDLDGDRVVRRRPHHLAGEGDVHGRIYGGHLHPPQVSADGRVELWQSGASSFELLVDGAVVRGLEDLDRPWGALLGPDGRLYVENRADGVTVRAVGDGEVRYHLPLAAGELATGVAAEGGVVLVNGPWRGPQTTGRRVWRYLDLTGAVPAKEATFDVGVSAQNQSVEAHYLFTTTDSGRRVAIWKEDAVLLGDPGTGAPLDLTGIVDPSVREPGVLPFVDSAASWVRWSPSGRRLAVNSGYGRTMVVELDPRQNDRGFDWRRLELRGHTLPGREEPTGGWIYHLCLSHDGTLVASGAPLDPLVRLWDARTGEQVAAFERDCNDPGSWSAYFAFAPGDERLVMTTPVDGRVASVVTWELASGDVRVGPTVTERGRHHLNLMDAFLAELGPADGDRLGGDAVHVEGRALVAYNARKSSDANLRPEPGDAWNYVPGLADGCWGLAVHPDGDHVAVVRDDHNATRLGLLEILEARTGELVREVSLDYFPWCCDYSPDGSTLALGTNEGHVLLLETETYTPLLHWPAHDWYVYALAWTSDGTRLVTASGDASVRIWDARARAESLEDERRWRELRARLAADDGLAGRYESLEGDERAAARVELLRALSR